MATVNTMEDAYRQAIKAYWKDNRLELKSFKDKKYNKKYFDGLESEFLSKEDQKKTEKKVKSYG